MLKYWILALGGSGALAVSSWGHKLPEKEEVGTESVDGAVVEKKMTTQEARDASIVGALGRPLGELKDTIMPIFDPIDPLIDPIIPILSIPQFDDGVLTFYFDNDLLGLSSTDENYTNGVRLSWISSNKETVDELPLIHRALARLPRFDRPEKGYRFNDGFSLTQLMFTPEDIALETPLDGERPYAGWLGIGYSIHAKNQHVLHSLEFNVGLVGPDSLAENAQDTVHDFREIPKAQGWDSQLPNELTLNLFYTRKQRLFDRQPVAGGLDIEGVWDWGFSFGNYRTDLHAGATMRMGYNLPIDFSPAKLDVTAYTHQLFDEKATYVSPWSVYVLAGVEAKATAFDVALDGTLLSDSPSVDRRPYTADMSFGLGVRYSKFSVLMSQTYRTKEFETQGDDQWFGSLSMSYAF